MDIDKNISDHTQLTADLSSSLSEKVENLTVEKGNVVIIDYKDLLLMNSDLNELIKKAYNEKGLGILAIKNVPGYVSARKKLLNLAYSLAHLKKEDLEKITFPEKHFCLGWSHGKEKFKGKADFSKGSFYAPPVPLEGSDENASPNSRSPWPEEIPELKENFEAVGKIIVECGILLAKHIDKYVYSENKEYPKNNLEQTISESDSNLARLLYYFPQEEEQEGWCGLHNDHGSLTGLCSAIYFDKSGHELKDFKAEKCGLFILSRDGKEYKAVIPSDCIAFQIGETMQIQTGGMLRATPHRVKSGPEITGTGISRGTLAVFMQPRKDEKLVVPKNASLEDVYGHETDKIPALSKRYDGNMTFGQFGMETIKSFNTEENEE